MTNDWGLMTIMPQFDRPTILMCPPDFYGIEYEINPWMNRNVPSDVEKSRAQWQALYELLCQLGVDVRLMQPVKGLPDLVFTANAGLVWRDTVFVASFRHAARQGETPVDTAWFVSQGFQTTALPGGQNFEGAGDALFCGDTLYAGYLVRSDASAMLQQPPFANAVSLQLSSEKKFPVCSTMVAQHRRAPRRTRPKVGEGPCRNQAAWMPGSDCGRRGRRPMNVVPSCAVERTDSVPVCARMTSRQM